MILADTTVVLIPIRRFPATQIAEPVDYQALERPHLSAIPVTELRLGVR